MASLKRIFTILIVLSFFFPAHTAFARDRAEENAWSGTLNDGTIIDDQDLTEILADHQKWIDSTGGQGRRANLAGANLRGVNLEGANLQEALLWGCDLQGADLSSANFQGAILREANFQKAELRFTNLQDAYLHKADFRGLNLNEVVFQKAVLQKANLQGANLRGVNLQQGDLWGANLQGADLQSTNLQGAVLWQANLQKAFLNKADLRGADLQNANLQKAVFESAKLQGADLAFTSLQGASFYHTNLQGADLLKADLEGVVFEIEPNHPPYIPSVATALNLSLLEYNRLPYALVELRKAFKQFGLRRQEREITYAIKHSGFKNALDNGNLLTKLEVVLGWVFFEETCEWGMAPERPLFILLGLICLFTIPYTLAISGDIYDRKKTDGIWIFWIPGRMRDDLGKPCKELLDEITPKSLKYAFFFSVLSAFHLGWRDINIGNWIARLQRHEYRLQTTGWARTLSGIQSLLSVYLLALSVLTYFGSPFESY